MRYEFAGNQLPKDESLFQIQEKHPAKFNQLSEDDIDEQEIDDETVEGVWVVRDEDEGTLVWLAFAVKCSKVN